MKSRAAMLAVSLALAAGCTHTKTTDKGVEKPEASQENPKAEKPKADAPHARGGSELHPGDRSATPVATAPEGLLAPGADKKIRQRLVDDGFVAKDAEAGEATMREGLRKFQKAHDLPATGMPDHETVKKMGLDTDQIFRKKTVKD